MLGCLLGHWAAGATGWSSDPPLALAPSLSAAPADRIIVALDGLAPAQVGFAGRVDGLRWVKVGLELFVQAGPEVVAKLRELGLDYISFNFNDTSMGVYARTGVVVWGERGTSWQVQGGLSFRF